MPIVLTKYRPHLPSLMALCDINYMLLIKLLANKEAVGEQRCFFISDFLSYRIVVNEVTRYTSLITIKQETTIKQKTTMDHKDILKRDADSLSDEDNGVSSQIDKDKSTSNIRALELLHPKMMVRLYHDARMAEIISNQGVKQIKPRYDYPNKKMHLPDEKQQINFFLKEWLQLCLQLGHEYSN